MIIQKVNAADPHDSTYWLGLAGNAWEYFKPGNGVNAETGLHKSGLWFPYFTDWDLGVYVQAIIDAEKLGLVSSDGSWGSNYRFDKILSFLETRPHTANKMPYVWYSSDSGLNAFGDNPQNSVEDAGKLLLSLRNLKLFRPSLEARIDNIVYNLYNYEPFFWLETLSGSASIYKYYSAMGFAGFWPERFSSVANAILNNIVSAPTVSTYSVALPKSQLTCEPLLHSLFELQPDARLQNLMNLVYQAHEARYEATGKYVAFSEGAMSQSPWYVYEWVVLPDGQTWVQQYASGEFIDIPEILYLKVALGFMAIYNTTYVRNLVDSIMTKLPAAAPSPSTGYVEGVDENGQIVVGPNDKTNSMIISAARYATESAHQIPIPSPSPSQYPIITPTPTSTPTAMPIPTSTFSPTPFPTPTGSPESPFLPVRNLYTYGVLVAFLLIGIAAFLFIRRHYNRDIS